MFQKEVKTKDGTTKNVIAQSQKELDDAVKDAKVDEATSYPDINVPVEQGHDLVSVDDKGNVTLVDGTGDKK